LNGLRISINHTDFGALFSCVLHAKGSLVDLDMINLYEFTTAQLLNELAKYGFWIEYNPVNSLNGNQIQFLMTLKDLNFDKIRVLDVWSTPKGVKEFTTQVVAFNVKDNPYWINNGYAPSISEYENSLREGTAFNVSAISESKKFDWSWLVGFVGDIDDIIQNYAEAELCQ